MNYIDFITEGKITTFTRKTPLKKVRESDYVIGYHSRIELDKVAPQYNGGMEFPFKDKDNWPMHVGTKQQAAQRLLASSLFTNSKTQSIVMYRVVGMHKFSDIHYKDVHDTDGHRPSDDPEDAHIYRNEYEGPQMHQPTGKILKNDSFYSTRPSQTIKYMIPIKVLPVHSIEMLKYLKNCGAFTSDSPHLVSEYFSTTFIVKYTQHTEQEVLNAFSFLEEYMDMSEVCEAVRLAVTLHTIPADSEIVKRTIRKYTEEDKEQYTSTI